MDAETLKIQNEVGYWGSDPDYSIADWQYEVMNGDTRKGYWEWLSALKFEG